jgi:hypothetical protein
MKQKDVGIRKPLVKLVFPVVKSRFWNNDQMRTCHTLDVLQVSEK